MAEKIIEVADFGSVVRGNGEGWVPASFPMPDGSQWVYQEPNAVVQIQNETLTVSAVPFSRSHDAVQFFDNAKHMYFSTESFGAPEGGAITLSWELSARIHGGQPGDLYDGFVSFHLMDLAHGVALNFFVGNEEFSTVYAHLPFPGAVAPERESGPTFFAWFEEHRGGIQAGDFHRYSIRYDRAAGTISWCFDGEEIKREENAGDLGPFTLAMGIMTEKDIVPGKGSISCHGQGAQGRWRNIRAIVETP